MYKIALCDDDINVLNKLADITLNYSNDNNLQVQIYHFSHKEKFLEQIDQFDIYCLEMDLKEAEGMELAELIREKNPKAEIIILSADDFYLSFSYSIQATYYLQKPMRGASIRSALDIAFRNLQEKQCVIKTKDGYQKITLNDLLYINIEQRSSCFHFKNGMAIYSTCLHSPFSKENNYLLNHSELLLIEPSLILNLDNINKINREHITFSNGEIFYLPRKAYDKVFPIWSYYHTPKEREEIDVGIITTDF